MDAKSVQKKKHTSFCIDTLRIGIPIVFRYHCSAFPFATANIETSEMITAARGAAAC